MTVIWVTINTLILHCNNNKNMFHVEKYIVIATNGKIVDFRDESIYIMYVKMYINVEFMLLSQYLLNIYVYKYTYIHCIKYYSSSVALHMYKQLFASIRTLVGLLQIC